MRYAPLIETFSPDDTDQPSSLSIGPSWMESFQTFPNGTLFVYNLNFGDGEEGLEQTVLEAVNALQGLGSKLYAFEIGNEVDGWFCFYVLTGSDIYQASRVDHVDLVIGRLKAMLSNGFNTPMPLLT